MRKPWEICALFGAGAAGYPLLELAWRRYTHWSMAVTGGVCFVMLDWLFYRFRRRRLWKKCVIGAAAVTAVEFAVGCVVNLALRLDVWDYSARPMNILGQICPLYSFFWGLLCVPLCGVCGRLRRRRGKYRH